MLKNSILFCTSWNHELYKASGLKFLISYNKCQVKIGNLFVGYEGEYGTFENKNCTTYNLDKDNFLQCWLKANEDIIPIYLGGKAEKCKCGFNPFERPEIHEKGCRYNWFNRNCSRFFRKVATIHAAYEYLKKEKLENIYLIWLDADCFFKKAIIPKVFSKIFTESSVFYMRGQRPIPETGVFGFDLSKKEAHLFLKEFFLYYQTKRFRKYDRWDDSNIFYRVLKEKPGGYVLARDIASKYQVGPHSEVLQFSLLQSYLGHNKGLHGRILKIMQ